MSKEDSYYGISEGITVWVTQLFDRDPDNGDFTHVLETRKGIVESIDVDLKRSLFKVCFNVRYPNGRMHGASINQLRPEGCLLVTDDEILEKGNA